MKIAKEMLDRWQRIEKSLEEQSDQMVAADIHVDWSDISVLDAYLSDDWDETWRGPNPDTDEELRQVPAWIGPALDAPDGEGYFAFEGKLHGSSVERLRWVVMVRRNIDGEYSAYRYGGHRHTVKLMDGKFWRLAPLPWDETT